VVNPSSTLFASTKPVTAMFGQGSPSYVELSKLNAVQEGGEEEEKEHTNNVSFEHEF
jgi:hypothetical protein